MRFRRQGTCCSISLRSGWTFALRWRRKSWRPREAVSAIDEVHGFRYFDDRDLLGFVDGTENPRGEAVIDAALIGEEDAAFASGSYVIVQKYLHDLEGWNALSTEAQERIIGRTKLSDIELDELDKADVGAQCAHHDHREWERVANRTRQHALRLRRHG